MKRRISIIIILISFVGIIGFWIASSEIYYNSLVEHSKDDLRVYMNIYTNSTDISSIDAKELSQKLNGARVTFMKLDGTVISDSETVTDDNHSDREEVIKAIVDGEGYSVRSSKTIGEDMVYYCKKIDDNLVRIAITTSSEWKILGNSIGLIIWALLLDITICFIFAVLSTRIILNPVEKFAQYPNQRELIKNKYSELKPVAEIMEENERIIKKYIVELENEKKQVIEAEESKNEFISNITHEMNTPLTSIIGFANLLQNTDLDDKTKIKAVNNICKQGEKLSSLISCIINFNELDNDSLPAYDVNVNEIVKDIVESLEPSAKELGITIEVINKDEITLLSRVERVTEIVGNLLRNAIKYNKENGKIIIEIGSNNNPYLIVEDTGIGISKENKDKIFERFYTVDKSHNGKNGGFGLGLSVVKKICDNSGWIIKCESELDKGTKFIIEF